MERDLPPHYTADEADFDKRNPSVTAYGGQQNIVSSQPRSNAAYYAQNCHAVTVVSSSTVSNQNRIPLAGEGRSWNHKLCGCCDDIHACCIGFFCTPCMLCCILNSMDELTYCVFLSGTTSAALARTKIRTALGIKGSFCGDICCTGYCLQCVACQMYMELKDNGLLKNSCCYCGCDRDKQCYCA